MRKVVVGMRVQRFNLLVFYTGSLPTDDANFLGASIHASTLRGKELLSVQLQRKATLATENGAVLKH